MAKRPSLNPLSLVSESWRFLLKQPALWPVFVWFMAAPSVAMNLLENYRPVSDNPSIDRIGDMGYGLATLLFVFVTFWGVACVQVVGRRLIQSKAGRARTSFKSVRRDAVPLILPLFFTDLLRSLISLEWALLYIVPSGFFLIGWTECRAAFPDILRAMFGGEFSMIGFHGVPVHCFAFIYLLPLLIPAGIYMIRTMFFDVVIGAEGLTYRQALTRSKEVMHKQFWKTAVSLIGILAFIFIPGILVAFLGAMAQDAAFPQFPVIHDVVTDVVSRFCMLMFALASIALFGRLRKLSTSPREVKPKDI